MHGESVSEFRNTEVGICFMNFMDLGLIVNFNLIFAEFDGNLKS